MTEYKLYSWTECFQFNYNALKIPNYSNDNKLQYRKKQNRKNMASKKYTYVDWYWQYHQLREIPVLNSNKVVNSSVRVFLILFPVLTENVIHSMYSLFVLLSSDFIIHNLLIQFFFPFIFPFHLSYVCSATGMEGILINSLRGSMYSTVYPI